MATLGSPTGYSTSGGMANMPQFTPEQFAALQASGALPLNTSYNAWSGTGPASYGAAQAGWGLNANVANAGKAGAAYLAANPTLANQTMPGIQGTVQAPNLSQQEAFLATQFNSPFMSPDAVSGDYQAAQNVAQTNGWPAGLPAMGPAAMQAYQYALTYPNDPAVVAAGGAAGLAQQWAAGQTPAGSPYSGPLQNQWSQGQAMAGLSPDQAFGIWQQQHPEVASDAYFTQPGASPAGGGSSTAQGGVPPGATTVPPGYNAMTANTSYNPASQSINMNAPGGGASTGTPTAYQSPTGGGMRGGQGQGGSQSNQFNSGAYVPPFVPPTAGADTSGRTPAGSQPQMAQNRYSPTWMSNMMGGDPTQSAVNATRASGYWQGATAPTQAGSATMPANSTNTGANAPQTGAAQYLPPGQGGTSSATPYQSYGAPVSSGGQKNAGGTGGLAKGGMVKGPDDKRGVACMADGGSVSDDGSDASPVVPDPSDLESPDTSPQAMSTGAPPVAPMRYMGGPMAGLSAPTPAAQNPMLRGLMGLGQGLAGRPSPAGAGVNPALLQRILQAAGGAMRGVARPGMGMQQPPQMQPQGVPGMAWGGQVGGRGVSLGPTEPQRVGGFPGENLTEPGAVMHRYSPVNPIAPKPVFGPKPEDMSNHLPTKLRVGKRINVRLPRPSMPGQGGVKMG